MTPTESIRALVGRYQLGYYFNPGGCEFFCPAHPDIPHCQTSEYGEEEDHTRLATWCAQHEAALTTPRDEPYVWYSEGEWARVIMGRYFRRCTLAYTTEVDGVQTETARTFGDIEEHTDGWKLIPADDGPAMWFKPETPEARIEWEQSLFRDKP